MIAVHRITAVPRFTAVPRIKSVPRVTAVPRMTAVFRMTAVTQTTAVHRIETGSCRRRHVRGIPAEKGMNRSSPIYSYGSFSKKATFCLSF